jgi:quercetin dioxygenase-like cupin family protein
MTRTPAYNWHEIPGHAVRPGLTQRGFRSDNVLVTHNVIGPDLEPNPHRHPFEQVFMILQGRLRLHIEDEVHDCGPGTIMRIPPNALHWAEPPAAADSPVINVDIFSPVREDYLPLVEYQRAAKEDVR